MFETQYLSESGESLVFRVVEEAQGFGNRPSARPLRIAVENLLEQFPAQRLLIDFSEVNIVSASFADEFIDLSTLLLFIPLDGKSSWDDCW